MTSFIDEPKHNISKIAEQISQRPSSQGVASFDDVGGGNGETRVWEEKKQGCQMKKWKSSFEKANSPKKLKQHFYSENDANFSKRPN